MKPPSRTRVRVYQNLLLTGFLARWGTYRRRRSLKKGLSTRELFGVLSRPNDFCPRGDLLRSFHLPVNGTRIQVPVTVTQENTQNAKSLQFLPGWLVRQVLTPGDGFGLGFTPGDGLGLSFTPGDGLGLSF